MVARIKLGIPLDLLLDRTCRLEDWERDADVPGGIRIPEEDDPANCNIVLRGRPGTGKSLLAMQMAVKCCRYNPGYFAMYFSLEESWHQVHGKAKSFGWHGDLEPLASLSDLGAFAPPDEYGRQLKHILTRPTECPLRLCCMTDSSSVEETAIGHTHRTVDEIPRKVIVGSLSPRSLALRHDSDDTVFTTRYQELQHLLHGAAWLRTHREGTGVPRLGMVCIDSLNVFGDRLLTREQIHQLFDLFQQQRVVGVFVMEEDEAQLLSPDTRLHADTIEYLCDTVIALHACEDSDYFVRYFEIVKSRYQHQVYGKHPFRIVGWGEAHDTPPDEVKDDNPKHETQEGLVIYPSLHYIVYGTEPKETMEERGRALVGQRANRAGKDTSSIDAGFPMGDDDLGVLLPTDCHRGDVVLIVGPRGTFKHTLAVNFLLSGLLAEDDDTRGSGLLIRLHDRPGFVPSRSIRLSRKLRLRPWWFRKLAEDKSKDVPEHRTKYSVGAYRMRGRERPEGRLIELAFKSGNILAEEFLHHVRYVIRQARDRYPIRRIVLSEVGLLGVNYPFLKKSRTAGEIFLTALIHTLRNYRDISFVMTGTTEQFREADDMIDRARTLADAVLTTSRCDVFGNRLVVVEGERLMTGLGKEYPAQGVRRDFGEYVPGVVVPYEDEDGLNRFEIDLHRLDGLVGFGTESITRPVLICRVLEEGKIQEEYNRSVETMLAHTFGKHPREGEETPATGIQIDRYSSVDSAVVFDSLELRRNRPLEQTVVAAIDEFCLGQEEVAHGKEQTLARSAFVNLKERITGYETRVREFMDTMWADNISHAHPYYANVLLLAYRTKHDDGRPVAICWDGEMVNLAEPAGGILPQENRATYRWTIVEKFVRSIHNQLEERLRGHRKKGPDGFCLFDWMDVPETWACILLDAVVNAAFRKFRCDPRYRKEVIGLLDIPEKTGGQSRSKARKIIHKVDKARGEMVYRLLRNEASLGRIRRPLIHSVLALQRLFFRGQERRSQCDMRENGLNPRAAAYVCWYSQLRNLIRDHPSLADKLDVCPLPGGGFRGDWFLGVAHGSVSVALGVELVETLCREDEEYRRFSLGVGMPVRQKFYDKGDYFAWQGGQHVKLKKIQAIHHDALTRECIQGYRRFRNVLQTVCHQVVGKPREVVPYSDDSHVWETLRRIPSQIEMLLPS